MPSTQSEHVISEIYVMEPDKDWGIERGYLINRGIVPKELSIAKLNSLTDAHAVKDLVVYENFVKVHGELLRKTVMSGVVSQLTIIKNHPFGLSDEIMDSLDSLALNKKINIIVNGHYTKQYENLSIYNVDTFEYCMNHDFILGLSTILATRRDPSDKILLQVVPSDDFRKTVVNALYNSAIQEYIQGPNKEHNNSSNKLYTRADNFLLEIEKDYGPGMHVDAIGTFGNGLPNMEMYESVMCEIVLETQNHGPWHFTEKTFRPIALGVPIVHLGHKPIYEKLLEYGYQHYDHDFYEMWHSQMPLDQKLGRLSQFLKHMIDSDSAKLKMEQIAKHNYENFWTRRKMCNKLNDKRIVDDVFGEVGIENKIYRRLNF